MDRRNLKGITAPLCFALAAVSLLAPRAGAQQTPAPRAPRTAQAAAPVDLTGYWVAVITEDWRYRMITPPKGDFPGVPVTPEGKRVANNWDPAKDKASGEACKSYGAGGIMRVPTRLHITWDNDSTLRVDTDAGTQTRLFHFGPASAKEPPPSWQGYSTAMWDGLRAGGDNGAGGVVASAVSARDPQRPTIAGYLKVTTNDLRAGYVRKNGVPYSSSAAVEEYFDSFRDNGDTWLVVTTVVTDPVYYARQFITSSHFKKLPDATGWNPTPCEVE